MLPMDLSSDFSESVTKEVSTDYDSVSMDVLTMIPEYIDSLDKGDLRDKIVVELEDIYNDFFAGKSSY